MATIKNHHTKSLFYSKYLYKIAFTSPIAEGFKGNNKYYVDNFIKMLKSIVDTDAQFHRHSISQSDITVIQLLSDFLLPLEKTIRVRTEYDSMSIFSTDITVIHKIAEIVDDYVDVVGIWSPKTDKIGAFLLANKNAVIKTTRPFRYKVELKYIGRGKYSDFQKWAIQLRPKVEVNLTCYSPYFFVQDDKTLNMCQLFVGTNIRKIIKYVIESEIV